VGRRAFGLVAAFAHHHLGIREVCAGFETTNTASERALLAAGFDAVTGPETHLLPDGRTVPATWLRHTSTVVLRRCTVKGTP
jgi:RimJ/RimL family protein N-acetyltransferase